MLGVYTDLLHRGGVQRMGRHMAAVQSEFARLHGEDFMLWSLSDERGMHELEVGGEQCLVEGFGRARLRMALRALAVARNMRFVYFNHPHLAPIGAAMKLLNPRLRYQVHVHGIEAWSALSLTRQYALRGAELVTATSRDTGEMLLKTQRLRPPRVEVLYPALDPGFLSAQADDTGRLPQEIGNLTGKRFFLTVSRIARTDAYKGIDTTIEAFARLAADQPDVRFAVVGQGDDLPRLQALAKTHGLEGRVCFLGSQPDSVLRQLYAQCEFFVLPSGGEGFGIVFLEAMARGKPCIGANVGGTPEVVLDGETGILVPVGDPVALEQAMRSLLGDDALRERHGARGLVILNERFLYEHFKERMMGYLGDARP